MGLFSKIRRKNPVHPSYWIHKNKHLKGARAWNRKHKVGTFAVDPRYWVSSADLIPYAAPALKGGKLVSASVKVVRKRKAALRYVKKTSRDVDDRLTSRSTPAKGRGRTIRRYGDDWY